MTSNRNNIQKKLILAIFILLLVVIICFLVLKFMHDIQNLTLQNTWRSEETGQVLTFTHDNLVEFDGNLPDGIYHILSPNTMEYTIDNKTFKMIYQIEKNKLYWGIDESNMECFVKVWL